MPQRAEVKMYSDYKSPYAYLAFDPGFALEQKFDVRVRWRPFQLRIKGKGQRSVYSEYKVRYSYLDARRWANLRPDPLVLKGPLEIYDTTPALIGGLYAEKHGRLLDYSRTVFERFFRRELEVDQADAVAAVVAEFGLSEAGYRDYLAGEGMADYERAQEAAAADRIFGVPIFVFAGEPFWGHDRIAAAYAGVTDQIGEAGGAPAQLPIAIGDVSTGVAAAMAIGFALLHRERTGEGQYIDCAILDTYFHMHEVNVPRVALRGDAFTPGRAGSQHPDGGPTGNFRCGDGRYINITALAHQWGQLAAAMGRPELADDPRFRDARARRDNNGEIKALIEAWLGRIGSREAALRALERHRVPCAPVLTLNEAVRHEHLRARGTVRQVSDPHLGAFAIPGLPVRFSRWPDRTDVAADLLGAGNEAVLKEVLGLSDAEIAALYDEQVLVRDPSLQTPMVLSYRHVAPSDRNFCVDVHHLAMRAYVEPLWGWDEKVQDRVAWEALEKGDATHEVALAGGRPIGYLSYKETSEHLFLAKLFLHPAHQGRGYGSAILARLIAGATSAGRPVELSVLTTNPRARAFYTRHGFVEVAETRERVRMRRVGAP